MGTWGTGIFADDLAADVRDEFTDLIGDGLSAAAATKRLVTESSEEIEDEPTVFWIALAATQWKIGHVVESV